MKTLFSQCFSALSGALPAVNIFENIWAACERERTQQWARLLRLECEFSKGKSLFSSQVCLWWDAKKKEIAYVMWSCQKLVRWLTLMISQVTNSNQVSLCSEVMDVWCEWWPHGPSRQFICLFASQQSWSDAPLCLTQSSLFILYDLPPCAYLDTGSHTHQLSTVKAMHAFKGWSRNCICTCMCVLSSFISPVIS